MASILTVDNLVGKTTANNIHIPGHVVQVIDGRTISYSNHATTSYSNTNLAVTITPKYANSKLFFSVSGVFWWNTATQAGSHQSLWFQGNQGSYNSYDRTVNGQTSIDNDSTTTRTYTVQARTYFGHYEVRCFEHTADNLIRVMEIAQ